MKTNITRNNNCFKPISINLTLDTAEELKQFLILTSALGSTCAFNVDSILSTEIDKHYKLDPDDMTEFIDSLISAQQWHELSDFYRQYVSNKS